MNFNLIFPHCHRNNVEKVPIVIEQVFDLKRFPNEKIQLQHPNGAGNKANENLN